MASENNFEANLDLTNDLSLGHLNRETLQRAMPGIMTGRLTAGHTTGRESNPGAELAPYGNEKPLTMREPVQCQGEEPSKRIRGPFRISRQIRTKSGQEVPSLGVVSSGNKLVTGPPIAHSHRSHRSNAPFEVSHPIRQEEPESLPRQSSPNQNRSSQIPRSPSQPGTGPRSHSPERKPSESSWANQQGEMISNPEKEAASDLRKKKIMVPWVLAFVIIGIGAEVNKFGLLEYNSVFVKTLLVLGTIVYLAIAVLALTVNRRAPEYVLVSMVLIQLRLLIVQVTRLRQIRELDGVELPATARTQAQVTDVFDVEMITFYILFNTIFCCFIIKEQAWRIAFCVLSIFASFIKVFIRLDEEALAETSIWLLVLFYCIGFAIIMALIVRVLLRVNKEHIDFLLDQQHESNQFKRIVNSVEEGMLIVEDSSEILFLNRVAARLLGQPDKDEEDEITEFFNLKRFFTFNRAVENESESKNSSPESEEQRVLSLADLLEHPELAHHDSIFTFRREIAECKSLGQLEKIASMRGEKRKFDFFMIKLIKLEERINNPRPEVAIQFLDISSKIHSDYLKTEKQYLSYITATVSHEMRNPLNSISAQIETLGALLTDLQAFIKDQGRERRRPEATMASAQQGENILREMRQCFMIQTSSCKLLRFNVEDILALPQMKQGRLAKNIQLHNIRTVVSEVRSIQLWQATKKGVKLDLKFIGFEGQEEVFIDEQRFQQVLLNYQSNALKFLNAFNGRIRVLVQNVRAGSSITQLDNFRSCQEEFYGQLLSTEDDQEDLSLLFGGEHDRDKVVFSVFDNGVGIREDDKGKLYKLFGCLDSTRKVNTHGIGLGLVISKMITKEFGGESTFLSKHGTGSIFLSSFRIGRQGMATNPVEITSEARLVGLNSSQVKNEKCTVDPGRFKRLSTGQKGSLAAFLINEFMSRTGEEALVEKQAQIQNLANLGPDGILEQQGKVLIIDDEIYNCIAVQSICKSIKLLHSDQVVETATSGQAGVDLVKRNIHRREGGGAVCDFKLILTDCSMPFMDGYQCTRIIREALDEAGVQNRPMIIALTGHIEVEYQIKAFESGMDCLYPKPVSASSLQQLLLSLKFKFEKFND